MEKVIVSEFHKWHEELINAKRFDIDPDFEFYDLINAFSVFCLYRGDSISLTLRSDLLEFKYWYESLINQGRFSHYISYDNIMEAYSTFSLKEGKEHDKDAISNLFCYIRGNIEDDD